MKIYKKVMKELSFLELFNPSVSKVVSLTLAEVEKLIDETCPDDYCRTELKQKLKDEGK